MSGAEFEMRTVKEKAALDVSFVFSDWPRKRPPFVASYYSQIN
jgi:hypothetical protein